MKIIYACTIMNNESDQVVKKNIRHLEKIGINFFSIINSNKELNFTPNIQMNKVGDMKDSRIALLQESYKQKSTAYFIFDSDIDFTHLAIKDFYRIISYSSEFDFISLYYKGDPPIPAFFTLASSLNDFHNSLKNISGRQEAFFDDSEFNNPTYQHANSISEKSIFKKILLGKSYSRSIKEFTNKVDKKDTTTGGATIYFNEEVMLENYDWPKLKGKSLTWYDSYSTFLSSKKYSFAKLPIFVVHKRHEKTIQLNWDSVIRYVIGFNYYMKTKNEDWNEESLRLHTIELFFYIKGLIKKIDDLRLSKEEELTIKEIKFFMNINIFEINERIKLWG